MIEAAKSGDCKDVLHSIQVVGVSVDACVQQYRRTALHWACESGNIELCGLLIEQQALVDFKDRSGATALHWAAWNGHPEVIKLLLANGANKYVKDNDSETPAEGACDLASKNAFVSPRKAAQAGTTLLQLAARTRENLSKHGDSWLPPDVSTQVERLRYAQADAVEVKQKLSTLKKSLGLVQSGKCAGVARGEEAGDSRVNNIAQARKELGYILEKFKD